VDVAGEVIVYPWRLLAFVDSVKKDSMVSLALLKSKAALEVDAGSTTFKLFGVADDGDEQSGEMREWNAVPLSQIGVKRALEKVRYAASRDDRRQNLEGVQFWVQDGTIGAAAVDGKRCAMYSQNWGGEFVKGPRLEARVPLDVVDMAVRLLGDDETPVTCGFASGRVVFGTKEWRLDSATVDGKWPDVDGLLEKTEKRNTVCAVLDVAALYGALRRMLILCDSRKTSPAGVRLLFEKKAVKVWVDDKVVGSLTARLEAGYEGKRLEVEVNPRYLLDILGRVDVPTEPKLAPRLELWMKDAASPILLKPFASRGDGSSWRNLVMPMRQEGTQVPELSGGADG